MTDQQTTTNNTAQTNDTAAASDSHNSSAVDNSKKIIDGIAWFFGVVFILLGLNSPYPIVLVLWVTMGAVLLPPTTTYIKKQFNFTLSKKIKAATIIVGLFLTMLIGAAANALAEENAAHNDRDWWAQFYADYYSS